MARTYDYKQVAKDAEKLAKKLMKIPQVSAKHTSLKDGTKRWVLSSTAPNSKVVTICSSEDLTVIDIEGSAISTFWNSWEYFEVEKQEEEILTSALTGKVGYNRSTIFGLKEICFKLDDFWYCVRNNSGYPFQYVSHRKKLRRPRKAP